MAFCPEMLRSSFAARTARMLSNCWTCLLRSLMDDDESIRSLSCVFIADVIQDSRAIHPAIALDRALEYYIDDVDPAEVVLTLVNLIASSGPVVEEEEDSQSFEKGDSDTFHDPLFHSILLSRFVKTCASRNAQSFPTGTIAILLETLQEFVGIDVDISDVEMIIEQRRSINQLSVDLLKAFLISGALETVDERFRVLNQQSRDRIASMSNHWVGHCVHQMVFA